MNKTKASIKRNPKWSILDDRILSIESRTNTIPGLIDATEDCKSLLESIMRTIIVEKGGKSSDDLKNWALTRLYKEVSNILKVGKASSKEILINSIGAFINDINEFRNQFGEKSHGKDTYTLEMNRKTLADAMYIFDLLFDMTDVTASFLLNRYTYLHIQSTEGAPKKSVATDVDLEHPPRTTDLVAINADLHPAPRATDLVTPDTDLEYHPRATDLALMILVGAWNNNNKNDIEAIAQLLNIDSNDWPQKAPELLNLPSTPITFKNGIGKVINRVNFLELLGSRIIDQHIKTFKSLAITILKERDPALDLPKDERFMAEIHGKVLEYSPELRRGIAEGLAILSSMPDACNNCSRRQIESICILAIRGIFTDADWTLWGSLKNLLPTLAEVAPSEFLNTVERDLRLEPCPFDELFAQEGGGILGGETYLAGLLWALESLAWDEEHLVQVCILLGYLADRDPGGQYSNRPINSLKTILLPWHPQTLAPIDKRKVTINTLIKECPKVAWNLLIQFLPGQHQTTSGSHKPTWWKTISDDAGQVTHAEYWEQVHFYAELAVDTAKNDTSRLSTLIEHFENLPDNAFDKLIEILTSETIINLPEDQRLLLWEHLTKLITRHQRYSDAPWVLPDNQLSRIETTAERLIPTNPFNLYQHLFVNDDWALHRKNGNWEEQRKKLDAQRVAAISEIYRQHGIEGVIQFSETVDSPWRVGYAVGAIDDNDDVIEQTFLPNFLDVADDKHKIVASNFVLRKLHSKGWEWCDNINKSDWTSVQVGCFLSSLPFTNEVWGRAAKWLEENENEYWSRTTANAYQADGDITVAIEKLLEYGRPYFAINCLFKMHIDKQSIDTTLCIQALLAAVSSSEHSTHGMDGYNIVELIKFLQSAPSVDQGGLFKVEWAYLKLLRHHQEVRPKLIENKLANDPQFFCEIIQAVYRSRKEGQSPPEPTEERKRIAENAWELLFKWRTPPGTNEDGAFSVENFRNWLSEVKKLCEDSGHLAVAWQHVGQVLFYAQPDPNGLWIHSAVAQILDGDDAEEMRKGFSMGSFNSHGAQRIDINNELKEDILAQESERKAKEVEDASFHRFAIALRDLAKQYRADADRTRDLYGDRDND